MAALPPVIRPETSGDIPQIREILKSAFGQDAESRLVDLLRQSPHFIPELSLVAEADGRVIGHILFSRIKIVDDNWHPSDSLALAPMAVEPGFQRQGVGGLLIRAGLEKARQLGYRSVVVLGHSEYYPRFGFSRADRWGIKTAFPVPPENLMAIELVENGLEGVSGMVNYPEEFLMV